MRKNIYHRVRVRVRISTAVIITLNDIEKMTTVCRIFITSRL